MTKYSDNLTNADVQAVLLALPDHAITGDEIAMIISEIALRFCGNSLEALLIMGGGGVVHRRRWGQSGREGDPMTPDQYRREGAEAMRASCVHAVNATASPIVGTPYSAGGRAFSDAIRAIDVDEVLARLSPATDAVARLVEAARAGLNYLENTEGEFGITLGSATGLRTALAAMEASHDRT